MAVSIDVSYSRVSGVLH